MINTIAISGYRSLRDIVIPLGQLSVVTGANGTGKSSIYRALRLLADIADDRIIASLAREGGFQSVQWAGPEKISRAMRQGSVPIQGTTRKNPVALKLGVRDDQMSYSIELGVGSDNGLFSLDPSIKCETIWTGDKPTPAKIVAKRHGASVQGRDGDYTMQQLQTDMPGYESMVRHITGQDAPWEISQLRQTLATWRFYDHIRTDADAPARLPQVGTRTPRLSPDGADLAAAVQTIFEVGDRDALENTIALAFPGARLHVENTSGLFRLQMSQLGMLRSLDASELSDGTLRFILLAAALLTPRPPPLMVLNEPESSLHANLIPALAALIKRASEDSQIMVVSHNRVLVSALMDGDSELVELHKDCGETFATLSRAPNWYWPKR